ncbi:MAG: hypothetical protein KGK33_08155 [Hyphomicrobiales bacterium]|nr:hypothetical protein [Hyphomicrobiales bacterium]
MSTPDPSDVTVAVTTKADSIRLRGVAVTLKTDLGQIFIADCARNTEGLISDSEIKTKYELSEADWEQLASNAPLLRAVRAERERRIADGVAAKEGARRHFAKAPNVLSEILTNKQVPPRHRIEAARELRQAAGDVSDAALQPGEKFTINIDLGTTKLHFEETIGPRKPSLADDGEVP